MGQSPSETAHARLPRAPEADDRIEALLNQMNRYWRSLPVGICLVDSDLRVRVINEWLARTAGGEDACLGRSISEAFPSSAGVAEPNYRSVFESGEPIFDLEVSVPDPRDPERALHLLINYFPVKTGAGHTVAAGALVRDATERKRAELALEESNERLQLMADALPFLIAFVGVDLRFKFTNRAFERIFGLQPGSMLGLEAAAVLGPEMWSRAWPHVELALQGESVTYEPSVLVEGRIRSFESELTPLFGADGELIGIFNVARDVTEARESASALAANESELRASQQQLHELAGRLMRAQERERARVSTELDVRLNQVLGVIALELAEVERVLPADADADAARADVGGLHRQVAELSDQVYRIARRLRPSILDDVGLVGAIEAECAALHSTHGIRVRTRLDDSLDRLPPDVSLCFYRVVQEGLQNLARHAGVEQANLTLSQDAGYAELRIEDSGTGFDPDSAAAGPGLGLASMRERLRMLGGRLSVKTRPGAGTTIQAHMPVPRVGDARR